MVGGQDGSQRANLGRAKKLAPSRIAYRLELSSPVALFRLRLAGRWGVGGQEPPGRAYFRLNSRKRIKFDHSCAAPWGAQWPANPCNLNLKARWNAGKSRAPDSRGIASLFCVPRTLALGPRARWTARLRARGSLLVARSATAPLWLSSNQLSNLLRKLLAVTA
jgi:hypothetical protein